MPRTLLSFHKRPSLPSQSPSPLSEPTKRALRNLLAHRRVPTRPAPRARSAAVLVALFIGRWGDLHVLLSSRAESMSSYAGDTALPGGRVDPTDASLEDTARREAFEEIGLPQDKSRVLFLCTLEPFLARNRLVVTPVVVLITDQTLRPILNEAEVKALFSHPLQAFLSESPPKKTNSRSNESEADPERAMDALTQLSFEDLQVQGTLWRTSSSTAAPEQPSTGGVAAAQESEDTMVEPPPYHTHLDIAGMGGSPMRMHSFLTGREGQGLKPVYGLTSAILIHAARVAYAPQKVEYEVYAPGQKTNADRIAHDMKHEPVMRDAALAEGLGRIWGLEATRGRRRSGKRRSATVKEASSDGDDGASQALKGKL